MSRTDRKHFANEQFGKHLIPPSDSNHSEHERWLREREEDRQQFDGTEHDRRATPRVKNDEATASSEEPEVVKRTYVLEPRWSICVIDGRVVQPSNLTHTDHELWRRWQNDIAIDTKGERVMRLHLERMRPHLLKDAYPDLEALARENLNKMMYLETLAARATIEDHYSWFRRAWLRLLGRSARIELDSVKKYLG